MRARLVAFAASVFLTAAPAFAEVSTDRSVKIIESLPQTPPPDTPAGPDATAPGTSGPEARPMTAPVIPDADQRADNSAGLALEVVPGTEFKVGDTMSFRVTSEKQGYLVLVDVDSTGKLTQIYPNTESLKDPQGMSDDANLIKRGQTRIVPDPTGKASFQFVASPPTGVGMVVAILSDKPVQMIDLPDVPAAIAGRRGALDYVRDNTRILKILPASDTGHIEVPKWSFITKFYSIQ